MPRATKGQSAISFNEPSRSLKPPFSTC